ncbi:MAG: rolling circle replication-associated protein [Ktedonobacteraceae bacterium]
MTHRDSITEVPRFLLPSLDDQADLAEKHGIDTLLFCPNPWALRHVFINQDTGEVVRARCNRWDCLYCGPRKVDQWRQLVKAAEPTLFITLTKAGKTVEEASRAMTTFLQYLRRGSKGRGPNHIGERLAYLIEYFAVLERHSDFDENGFHWHLLVKGVDFIPHEVLKEAWRSARHGEAYIVDVQAIRKPHVIGYVTKYLTKSLSRGEKGIRSEEREKTFVGLDENGNVVEEQHTYTVELTSKARRIRYSHHFFPEKVALLRAKLFAEIDEQSMEQTESQPMTESSAAESDVSSNDTLASEAAVDDNSKPLEEEPQPIKRSSWTLVEREEFTSDLQEYRRRRRVALVEALTDLRDGRNLSRRVINIWAYQRREARWAS